MSITMLFITMSQTIFRSASVDDLPTSLHVCRSCKLMMWGFGDDKASLRDNLQ